MIANGAYIWGKGIWISQGKNLTVENISFEGAQVPDFNGAGIRLDGEGLTVRHCFFHENEMGILTNNSEAGKVIIEYSEFGFNGYGDGFSHNIYVNHVDSFIFRYNYSHHSHIGHTLKSRANHNIISYNRFDDGPDGQSSRLIDIPNGGTTIIVGNEFIQGPLAENQNIIGYGLEGLTNESPHEFYFTHNTVISRRSNALFFHLEQGTAFASVRNNVFIGKGTLSNGVIDDLVGNAITEDENWFDFNDVMNDNFELSSVSSLINAADHPGFTDAGFDLSPTLSYVHPAGIKTRTLEGLHDIGAHEYNMMVSSFESKETSIKLFPNPAINSISIELLSINSSQTYKIYNTKGQLLDNGDLDIEIIDIHDLQSGMYIIQIGSTYKLFIKL